MQSLKSPGSPVVAALLGRPVTDAATTASATAATPTADSPADPAGAAPAVVAATPPVAGPDLTWRDEIAAEAKRQRDVLAGASPFTAPGPWYDRLARWLLQPRARPVAPPVDYNDLVQAAAGGFPAAYLRSDFDTMTITEWSRFTNAALAKPETWAFAAGLRALGFGQGVLAAADAGRFAEGAPPDRPGLWLVFAPNAEIVAPPDPEAIPMVFVPADDETAYKDFREWLIEVGALDADIRKED
jgi:hypothetical protein